MNLAEVAAATSIGLQSSKGDMPTNVPLFVNAACLLSSSLFSKGFTSGAKLSSIAHSSERVKARSAGTRAWLLSHLGIDTSSHTLFLKCIFHITALSPLAHTQLTLQRSMKSGVCMEEMFFL